MNRNWIVIVALGLVTSACAPAGREAFEPLPSWHDRESKQSILEFVRATTDGSSPSFVKPAERVAVFDNDGTLWSEKPLYFQLLFVIDRVKELAPDHPEWQTEQPFKAVLENDHEALAAAGEEGLIHLLNMKEDWKAVYPFE
jgi:hypothetical protein